MLLSTVYSPFLERPGNDLYDDPLKNVFRGIQPAFGHQSPEVIQHSIDDSVIRHVAHEEDQHQRGFLSLRRP